MTIEARVVRLERWNRILVVMLLLVAGGALGWRAPAQETPPTQRMEIVDDAGRPRITLGIDSAGPAIRILDTLGVARATLMDDVEGTALYLMDPTGVTRVGVAQFAHGGGGFALHGPESRGAAVLYLKGAGSLTFFDDDGRLKARFPGG